MKPPRARARLQAWSLTLLIGLFLGVAVFGSGALEGSPAGTLLALFVPAILLGLWVRRHGRSIAAISGLLIGSGAALLIVLYAALERCIAANSATTYTVQICVPPDITAPLLTRVALILGGLILAVISLRRETALTS